MTNNIYIGWDTKQDIAYEVCKYSLLKTSSVPIVVKPLKLTELRSKQLYTRPIDPLSSTEFTFSRFLVPYLNNYTGWAVFCDCDFLWVDDISNCIIRLTLSVKGAHGLHISTGLCLFETNFGNKLNLNKLCGSGVLKV